MKKDLTQGNITKTMLLFAGPMILGNLLQQGYNIVDTLIVGRFLGPDALAAVGSAYSLMTFLTSVIMGLCMGSGSVFSVYYGKKDIHMLRNSMAVSFLFIAAVTILINTTAFAGTDIILKILSVPTGVYGIMREYVRIIFTGIFFVFLYNYFAFLLRSLGNSSAPLIFLALSAVLNIFLDILFVVAFRSGVGGAAAATVISQTVSGIGIGIYAYMAEPELFDKNGITVNKKTLLHIMRHSSAASIQQSVMNFGILMIQGLVNSFGAAVMAAFAAAVKIDSFAYMPAQEFGNAFSLFISQNYGGEKKERVRLGTRKAIEISVSFCLIISVIIFICAPYMMRIFVSDSAIIDIGTEYLRIEGSFYCFIGLLFLLYGYCRGIGKPEMSLALTVISLGLRVLTAYISAPVTGVCGIWWAIPLGWCLADLTGIIYIKKVGRNM